MKKRIMAAVAAIAMLLSLSQIGAFATDPVSYSTTHNFDGWWQYFAEGGWRAGYRNSVTDDAYINRIIYRPDTPKFGGSSLCAYFTAQSAYDNGSDANTTYAKIDTANGINYLKISFDVALNNAASNVYYMLNTGAKFFEMNLAGVKLMDNAVELENGFETKRWYSIDMVEYTDGNTATWELYIDGTCVKSGAGGSVITAPYGTSPQYIFFSDYSDGSSFYLDNYVVTATNTKPVITAKTVNVVSTKENIVFNNGFPRTAKVPMDATVADVLDAIDTANLRSAEILSENSGTCEYSEDAAGKYLCVEDDNNSVIYKLTGVSAEIEPVTYSYTHNFEGWSSYLYENKWRLAGGDSTFNNGYVCRGAAKYGADTMNAFFSANAVYDYGYVTEAENKLAVINTANKIKYLTISFDVALENSSSRMRYMNQSGLRYFEISNAGVQFMNTAVSAFPGAVETKRWYHVDIAEYTDGATGTYDLYIDGTKLVEDLSGSAITSPYGNQYIFTSNGQAGSAFYLDNYTIAASNVEPKIEPAELALTSNNGSVYLRNTFPRTIVTGKDTTVEEILAAVGGCDSIVFKNEDSEDVTTGKAAGGYLVATDNGKQYIYNVTNGFIKDDWNSGSGLYTNHSQWGTGTAMGLSTSAAGGLYGKDAADKAKYYHTDSLVYTGNNPLWFVVQSEPAYNGVISGPQTYSLEMVADGSFDKLNWLFKLADGTNVFPIQMYGAGSMGSLGNGNVHKFVKGQWYKIDTVVYPSDRNIEVYVNGEKVSEKHFDGTGDLAINISGGTGFRVYPDFTADNNGKAVTYAVDNYSYYVGVPSYAESDIPTAEFDGCTLNNTYLVNEVISAGNAFGTEGITANGSVNVYDDSEGIKTAAVRSAADITTYYKVTEISNIDTQKQGDKYIANVSMKRSSLASGKPVLVVAAYDGKKLVDVIYQQANTDGTSTETYVQTSAANSAKAMLLESITNIRPMIPAKDFE